MDLQDILNKTKKRSAQIKVIRKPPSIASADRPYSEMDFPKENRDNHVADENNTSKTDNKLETNRQQTDNQTRNKPITNPQQIDNKENVFWETDNKPTTKPTTDSITNRQQSGNKVATKTSFSMLVGLQRACLLFVYQSSKATRSKMTEPLSLEHVAQHLKTTSGAIKTTFQRLVGKNCLMRIGFKNGRGGWSTYEIPEGIFTEMLRQETDNKLATNWQQTDNKLGNKPTTEPATTNTSSSNNIIKITNTTNLPEEWKNINFGLLTHIGFSETQLMQIYEKKLSSPDSIQLSIDHFAYGLEHNEKAKAYKDPLNVFMGVVRKGQRWIEANYESPQERALKTILEEKRAQKDRMEKLIAELTELEFPEWEKALSQEEKQKIVPADMFKIGLQGPIMGTLRSYFVDNVLKQKLKMNGLI